MANTPEGHFSRRTLAKGAAWAVPAVAVAAAAPAYAQSLLNTKPSVVTATRVDCDTADVTWTGIEGASYELQGFDGTDWTPTTPTAGTSSSNGVVSFASGTITKVRVRQVAGTAVSVWVESANLPAITAPILSVSTSDNTRTWSFTGGLSGASYTLRVGRPNATTDTLTMTAAATVTTTGEITSAILIMTACGTEYRSNIIPAGAAAPDSIKEGSIETSRLESNPAKAKSPETKAPASKKSAPTVEPTPSPTPTPEPSGSMVPDPEPIVTESVVLPEPVPVPTPSA